MAQYIHPTLRRKMREQGKEVPRPSPQEVESEEATEQEVPSLPRRLGAVGIRGLSGFLSTPGLAYGAGVAGAGETLAQMLEKGTIDPKEVDTRRVAVETGLGAIPFSKLFKAGKVGLSALRGGLYSGTSEGMREFAAGEDLDPKGIGLHTLLGGTIGGGAAKLLGPGKAVAKTDVIDDLMKLVTSKPVAEGVSDVGTGGLRIAPDVVERVGIVRKPGTVSEGLQDINIGKTGNIKYKSQIPSRTGEPEIPKVAEAKAVVRAQTAPREHAISDIDRGIAQAKTISGAERAANEAIRKAETKLLQKEITADVQDVRAIEKARATAAKEAEKAAKEAEKAAENARKLKEIEAAKAGRVPTAPSVRESVSAVTPTGARASKSQAWVEEVVDKGKGPQTPIIPIPDMPSIRAAEPVAAVEAATTPAVSGVAQTAKARAAALAARQAKLHAPTPIAPAAAPVVEPAAAEGGAIPVRFFKSPQEALGRENPFGYAATQAAEKAGEITKTSPFYAVDPKGRPITPARMQGAALSKYTKKSGELDSAAIAKLPEAEQDKVLTRLVKDFMSSQGKERGAAPIELAFRGTSALGGAVTGAALSEEDPLFGATVGLTAGVLAPNVIRGMIRKASAEPNLEPSKIAEIGSKARETLVDTVRLLPDYVRGSLLANLPNLPINTFVGPWGGAIMGATEATLAGERWGLPALKLLLNPKNFPKEMRGAIQEAGSVIEQAQSRAEGFLRPDAPVWFKETFGLPGRFMTAGDIAARRLLTRAGAPEEIARKITLTSEPEGAIGRGVSAFKKGARTKGGKPSIFVHTSLPFYRTIVNQFESGLERFPGLGIIYQRMAKDVPSPANIIKAQQILGTTSMAAAWALGTVVPPTRENQLLANKLISNFGGQYGMLMAAAFNAGQAYGKGGDIGEQIKAAGTEVGMSLPLPTAQPIYDVRDFLSEGKVPRAIIPQVLRPENPLVAPAAGVINYLLGGGGDGGATQEAPAGDYVHPTIRRRRQQQQQ